MTKAAESNHPMLKVENLGMYFPGPSTGLFKSRPPVKAVDGVSFAINKGKTLGLVGESGCGKSTTARLIMRILKPTAGVIELDGHDISSMSMRQLKPLRPLFQMVAQDPFSSLNPRMRVESILQEPLIIAGHTPSYRQEKVLQVLDRVGLSAQHAQRFPHEFSGGQRQRIAIARALVLDPQLVICDEPVSALDVSVQAQIINLMQDLQQDSGLTYLFVSHDLSVVKHIADDVAVMYLGKLVELGPKRPMFAAPRHPYTQALLSAIPRITQGGKQHRIVLKGDLPSPIHPPSGCRFHTRCPQVKDICSQLEPSLTASIVNGVEHKVACHFPLN
jgi:peptide/nickel transport system ATP-binding protein/oligopeptide transport system ATP-binding protein